MNKPLAVTETEWRVEVFSSDVIRAQAKRKALRRKLAALFVVKLVLTGATYLGYDALVGSHGVATDTSYVTASIAQ